MRPALDARPEPAADANNLGFDTMKHQLDRIADARPADSESERLDEFLEKCAAISVTITREQALELIESRAREIALPKVAEFLGTIFARFAGRENRVVSTVLRRALGLTSPDSLIRAAQAFQVAPEYLARLHASLLEQADRSSTENAGPSAR